ncbi:putative membrane protein [Paenibacillus sp. BK033]|uniref:PH domain-containing protein n=2 Tax=unclassified Paenibacillus TaxID=185978 RepID=UPI0010E4C47E|nr:PH domain-containing protein [Paenibacillus sp. BK033]NIK72379.1 putative membrane protein [Paenibacillus sp. BK720]TCM87980.1 putative membrane protein [Paenibacillus sp. BK033]
MIKRNKPRRLHPIYMLFPLFNTVKGLLPLIIITLLQGVNWSGVNGYVYLGILAAVTLLMFLGLFGWRKFSFTVEDDRIVIRKGILFRDEKTIYFGRIHSVNLEQPILQRLLGVTQVKIETPGGNKKADGILAALNEKDARQLQRLLLAPHDQPAEAAVQQQQQPNYQLTPGQLLLAAATSLNFGLVVAFIAGIFSLADDFINELAPNLYSTLYKESTSVNPSYTVIAVIAVCGLAAAWLLSLVLYVIKFAGFTANKQDDQISISYGLLEKKVHHFDAGKVQAVIVAEGLLHQWIGFAQIQLQVVSSDKTERLMLHPFISAASLQSVLACYVPQFTAAEIRASAPKRAFFDYVWKGQLVTILLCAFFIYFFHIHGLWSLILLPLAAAWSWSCLSAAGMSLEDGQLTLRKRSLTRMTYYMRRPQIVSMTTRRTRGQQKRRLLTVSAHVLGSPQAYRVHCLERDDAEKAWRWYSRHQAGK